MYCRGKKEINPIENLQPKHRPDHALQSTKSPSASVEDSNQEASSTNENSQITDENSYSDEQPAQEQEIEEPEIQTDILVCHSTLPGRLHYYSRMRITIVYNTTGSWKKAGITCSNAIARVCFVLILLF